MKKLIVLFLFVFVVAVVNAQDASTIVKTVKGKVIDQATNQSVSYTNIGLENTFYGTASNENGNFELKIPAAMVDKNIYFSAVGYVNLQFPVRQLFDKEFSIIKMESQSYGIEDIDIAAQSKVIERILRVASENIRVNYIGGPFNLNCRFTQNIFRDSASHKIEARVLIYDKKGYSMASKSDAYTNINYKITTNETEYRFAEQKFDIDELLGFDWVRTKSAVLNPGLLNGYNLKFVNSGQTSDNDFWVISFEQNPADFSGTGNYYAKNIKGQIVIGKTDYEVKQITGEIKASVNSKQGVSLALKPGAKNIIKNNAIKFEISYKNLVPEFIRLEKHFEENTNKISEKTKLLVDKVQTTGLTEINKRNYFVAK